MLLFNIQTHSESEIGCGVLALACAAALVVALAVGGGEAAVEEQVTALAARRVVAAVRAAACWLCRALESTPAPGSAPRGRCGGRGDVARAASVAAARARPRAWLLADLALAGH